MAHKREAQAYAMRAQTSNIFGVGDQPAPEHQYAGKRGGQGAQNVSHIFHGEAGDGRVERGDGRVERDSAPAGRAPAPFLTDNNAVDTQRLGGLVNMTDSIVDTQANYNRVEEKEALDNVGADIEDAHNANGDIARSHKLRQNTSNIFDSPVYQQRTTTKAAYDRNTMSNVF